MFFDFIVICRSFSQIAEVSSRLRQMYRSSFNRIKKKYEKIDGPLINNAEVEDERIYYKHLATVYAEEIENLLTNLNHSNSIANPRSLILQYITSLENIVDKIRKLAAGEKLDDSISSSDDDDSVFIDR